MTKNSSILAKEPTQSFVPGLLITFLKEKGYGDKESSKTQYNKSAKEAYLKLSPQDQAEIFSEFYNKYNAKTESGQLIYPEEKQTIDKEIIQHDGVNAEEIPQPPRTQAESKSWYELMQNSLYSSLATFGTLALGAEFLSGAAADDPTRGSTYPTLNPTFRPTFVPTTFPPSVNPTFVPSQAPSFSSVPTIISSILTTIQDTYNATYNSTSNSTFPSLSPSSSPSLFAVADQGHHDRESDWDGIVDKLEYWGKYHPVALAGVVVGASIVLVGGCCIGYMCCKNQGQQKVAAEEQRLSDSEIGNGQQKVAAEEQRLSDPEIGNGQTVIPEVTGTDRVKTFNLSGIVDQNANVTQRGVKSDHNSRRHLQAKNGQLFSGNDTYVLPQQNIRSGGGRGVRNQRNRASEKLDTAGPFGGLGGGR